jgi:ribonuclease BN (tRNA processing enzyme)
MSPPADSDATHLTVVGCGTAVPDAERVCSGFYLRSGSVRALLDCGPGVVHHLARFGLEWQRITHLALTHFHTDHIGDVPMLFFALRHGMPPGRSEPLTVLGPHGTRALIDRLAGVFGDHLRDPGFPVNFVEVDESGTVQLDDVNRITNHPTPHTAASHAYRLETPAGAIGYTGDTGYSEEVASFLRGCEIMISECSLPDDIPVDAHLTPGRLARMARVALPRRLVVSHVFPQLDRRDVPELLARAGWGGTTVLAYDGLRIAL